MKPLEDSGAIGPLPDRGDAGVEEVFDRAGVLQRVDGDEVLVAEITGLYLEDVRGKLGWLREALRGGDLPGLSRLSHRLRGASAGVGALALERVLGLLEEAAKEGHTERTSLLVSEVEHQFQRFAGVLDERETGRSDYRR